MKTKNFAKRVLTVALLLVFILCSLTLPAIADDGAFAQALNKAADFFDGIPIAVKAIGGLALAAYIIYEIFREDGELRPSNVFGRYPQKIFFDFAAISGYLIFLNIETTELPFWEFYKSDVSVHRELFIICAASTVLWVISEMISPRFWCGIFRIIIKAVVFFIVVALTFALPFIVAVVVIYAIYTLIIKFVIEGFALVSEGFGFGEGFWHKVSKVGESVGNTTSDTADNGSSSTERKRLIPDTIVDEDGEAHWVQFTDEGEYFVDGSVRLRIIDSNRFEDAYGKRYHT